MAILAFNYVDRQVLALVLQQIKTELHLTDTQLGFLSGIAFAAFYAVMGIPIARLADRGNRVAIVSATTALWSVFVMLCAAATSFTKLFLVRVGVAIGEAGCIPTAQSLLSDAFPRNERARAFAIYSLGAPLSVVLGGFAAGWIDEYWGWRATFVILGVPGLGMALVARLALREPRNYEYQQEASTAAKRSSGLRELTRTLATNSTYRHMLFANTVLYFFVYGILLQWQPTFFVRTYGLTTGEIGTLQLVTWTLVGGVSTYLGGEFVQRYMARDEQRQLRIMAISIAIFGALNMVLYACAYRALALSLVVMAAPFYIGISGPFIAITQSVVPTETRATAASLILFFANLVGMGLGGVAVGILSDVLTLAYGKEGLRYALVLLSPGFFWCAVHLWLASRTVSKDIERDLADPSDHDVTTGVETLREQQL
jgi:MFS transporter, Spinster family, sphingosine-1-phosphate transporter